MSKQWSQLLWLAGIVTILLVGCNQSPIKVNTDPQIDHNTATPTPTPTPAPKVWMTDFRPINGTAYLYAPIYVATEEQKSITKRIKDIGSASSASYEGRENYSSLDIRNYMFVHRDNLSANKLLANNNSRILEMEQIGVPATSDQAPKENSRPTPGMKTVKTLWYVKVAIDTNQDQTLDDRDRQQIAISDPSGANYTEIIRDIDKILLVHSKGIDKRLVIYISGNKHFVADVDILKRQATIKELPAVN